MESEQHQGLPLLPLCIALTSLPPSSVAQIAQSLHRDLDTAVGGCSWRDLVFVALDVRELLWIRSSWQNEWSETQTFGDMESRD